MSRPTLRPLPAAPAEERPDPATMGAGACRLSRGPPVTTPIASWRRRSPRIARSSTLLPTDANAWYRIGLAAGRLGRTDQALAAFDRVEALRPGSGDGALAAAQVEAEAGLVDQAAQRVDRDPRHAAGDRTGADRGRRACRAGDDRRRPQARRRRPARSGAGRRGRPRPAVRGVHRGAAAPRSGRGRGGARRRSIAWSRRWAIGPRPSTGSTGTAATRWRGSTVTPRRRRPSNARSRDAPFDLRGYISLATLAAGACNRDDDALATVERLVRRVPTPAGYAAAVRLCDAARRTRTGRAAARRGAPALGR